MATRNYKRGLIPTEADTLKAICDYCDSKRILYVRVNPIRVVSKKVDGEQQVRFARTRRSQIGAADLIVMPKGQVDIAVEVKSLQGDQSRKQIEWERRCLNSGRRYVVIKKIDDFIWMMEHV